MSPTEQRGVKEERNVGEESGLGGQERINLILMCGFFFFFGLQKALNSMSNFYKVYLKYKESLKVTNNDKCLINSFYFPLFNSR